MQYVVEHNRGPEFHPCQRLQLPTVVDLNQASNLSCHVMSCHLVQFWQFWCFKVACVDRWHWQTDSRPDKIVCEGAREATAVNGIIGVALRPLAIVGGFHVVILITILACCDDACTVWMWTTSWTFWTRFSITMGALLWIRGGSALKILKRPQTQTASVWWLSESRDAADESTGRTGFRAKSLQRTAMLRYHRHPFNAMGKSWPWGVVGCLDAVRCLCAGQDRKRDENDADCKHCMAGLIVKLLPRATKSIHFLIFSCCPAANLALWYSAERQLAQLLCDNAQVSVRKKAEGRAKGVFVLQMHLQ